MSNQINNQPEHDEVLSMLPWFVNQSLDGSQRGRVANHVKSCDDCQREIQFLVALNETVKSDAQENYNVHADVDKDFTSVMNRIDAKSHPTEAKTSVSLFLRQLLDEVIEFATARSTLRWSATALAGLMVAVVGFQVFYSHPDNDYSVLSSSDIAVSPMRLSIQFNSVVNLEQARALVQNESEKLDQQVDVEASTDGAYIIGYKDAVGVSDLSDMIVNLKKHTSVRRVEILP